MYIDKAIWKEDYSLVQQTLKGDENAWDSLYGKYYKLVRGFVRKIIFSRYRGHISADDVASEAFKISYEELETFRGKSKYSTWVCQIAKNLLLTEYKKCTIYGDVPLYINMVYSVYALPERIVIEKEWKTCICIAFNSLSGFQKTLVKMNVFDGIEKDDIARQMGLNVLFVKKELDFTFKTLKKRFLYLYKKQRLIC